MTDKPDLAEQTVAKGLNLMGGSADWASYHLAKDVLEFRAALKQAEAETERLRSFVSCVAEYLPGTRGRTWLSIVEEARDLSTQVRP